MLCVYVRTEKTIRVVLDVDDGQMTSSELGFYLVKVGIIVKFNRLAIILTFFHPFVHAVKF